MAVEAHRLNVRTSAFRLRTMLLLMVPVAVGLGWWRDRVRFESLLDMRERQVRQLRTELQNARLNARKDPYVPFATIDEMIEFLQVATEQEFKQKNWSAFAKSDLAVHAVGPLTRLLGTSDSADSVQRHHAAWVLGQIGRNRRPPDVVPVPALMALLDDESDRVRAEAIYALGGYGSLAKPAPPHLDQIMHGPNGPDALWAARAVQEIDRTIDIGPRLRELFLTSERGVRHSIALLLPDHLSPVEARQFLATQYERETDHQTREILAQAMNKVKE